MLDLIESLNSFQHRSPKLYLGLVSACALFGIGVLVLLPVLSLNFFISGFITIFSLESVIDLSALLYQLPLSALFAYLTFQFVILPIEAPKPSEIYISINKKKTPKLIALIHEIEQHFNVAAIDNIILTDQFDINIHISPRYCIPSLGERSLQIGLPLLQTVSANQFKALLARRIGQLSFKNNRNTTYISFFSDILNQYVIACKQNEHWSLKPFYYFLKNYQDIFNAIAFYAVRINELQSDQYAIEITDEESFSQTLSQKIIANHYLKNTFWISIYKLQRQHSSKAIFPHANMGISFIQNIDIEEFRALIYQQFQTLSDFHSPSPLLRTRLLEMGFETYSLPTLFTTSAAKVYLDNALPKVTHIFDKLWSQRLHSQREAPIISDSNEQRLNILSTKISEQPLSAAETWELAVLTEKIKGYHFAIPIYKKILERNPMHAKAMFAIGRILLSYNDSTGLEVLNKAIFLEPAMEKTSKELIARYESRIANNPEIQKELIA